MTIHETEHRAQEPGVQGEPAGPPRVTRPALERDRPIRSWSTLFGPEGADFTGGKGGSEAPTSAGPALSSDARAPNLTDAVGQGYRVINEYLREGQRAAEGFRARDWTSGGPAPDSEEMQQLYKKVMQYGWDFMGLWFEMWNKMGPPSGQPAVPPPWGMAGASEPGAVRMPNGAPPAQPSASAPRAGRLVLAISSASRVEAQLELRPGHSKNLIIHALRPEGHEAPAIRGASVDAEAPDGSVAVRISIPDAQPAGVYNGMLIDGVTNLPRGTLTVTVAAAGAVEPVSA